jgi:predicted nucleic acid-binding protein
VRRGCVLLDSQALSLLIAGQELMSKRLDQARRSGVEAVMSAVTILEADYEGVDRGRRDFVLSRIAILDVDEELAMVAGELLRATRLHGHSHAIDAVVAATAVRQEAPVLIYTSDPGDLGTLCAAANASQPITIIKV